MRGDLVQADRLFKLALEWLQEGAKQLRATGKSVQLCQEVLLLQAQLQLTTGDLAAVERWSTAIETESISHLQQEKARLTRGECNAKISTGVLLLSQHIVGFHYITLSNLDHNHPDNHPFRVMSVSTIYLKLPT